MSLTSDYETDLSTKLLENTLFAGNAVTAQEMGMVVKTMKPITWTVNSATAATETVKLFRPYKDSMIVGIRIYAADPGDALTIDIGDNDGATGDPDRYVNGLAFGTSGGWFDAINESGTLGVAYSGTPYYFTGLDSDGDPSWVYITVDTATIITGSTNVLLTFDVAYKN